MRLTEAQSVVRGCQGKSYTWLKHWGISIVNEAIRTIRDRQSATDADNEYADDIRNTIVKG